ncbi:MAG: ATP-dependent DNA helicase RecG [Coriobacteriia bacterium]|nr:ATP-dependent DNA helicase RecG [Coriobacteriia bacterium]
MAGKRTEGESPRRGEPTDRLSATLLLDQPVHLVSQVSPARAKALQGLGIRTVRDLVSHYPRRYVDMTACETIARAQIGTAYTIVGQVHSIKLKRPKPRLSLVEITLVDGTGTLMVTCFRQPWLMDSVKAGMQVTVAGKLEFDYGFKRMTNPLLEVVESGERPAGGKVIPVHPACEKLSAAMMRRVVENALLLVRGQQDPLPVELRTRYRLMSRGRACECIHFPASMEEMKQARRRLAYEELLFLQIKLITDGAERAKGQTPRTHVVEGERMRSFADCIPFTLTEDQARAKDDVLSRLAEPRCANHLVLGDVGTGKTMVAAFACAAVSQSGTQALFMAPTEVLARQHAAGLGPLFDQAGVTWDCLTGSTSADERQGILERAAAGNTDVLFGTHALLEDDVHLKDCSLVIVDEQQRFGVDQRARLLAKGTAVDALYLTATPIPRTLALALYGDLTLSYLVQKPHAAQRTTRTLPRGNKGAAYDAAKEALARGEQVYVVCPLVGLDSQARDKKAAAKREPDEEEYAYAAISIESDGDLDEGNVTAAVKEAQFLQSKVFADYKVELLHGRMSADEKSQVMERFRSNQTQVLVATTVIEVGVDVPNATVMIVEDADRFGLSQLHQLRGRVGRGTKSAQVFLVSASQAPQALERLAAMEKTEDGFELATYDLSLRREGDILGNRQHGASALKLVNVVRDRAMVEAAHADAWALLQEDPNLEQPQHQALAREVRRAFAGEAHVIGG